MKKIISLIILCVICFSGIAQVKVYPADTEQFSIENLARYFVGRGVQISNVTYIGNLQAIGQFSDATNSIGISKGIILTTGKAKDAEGPNNTDELSVEWSLVADDDLNDLISDPTKTADIAVLEFDFVPLTDTIKFRAVYGSEEYDVRIINWDDPFAVFLSVADSTVKTNIATFVGMNGNEYVSVKNINHGFEARWGTPPSKLGENADLYIYNTTFSPNIQYNGYTKVLSFKHYVNPCLKYHLKIAIGDSKLGNFDSGVMLEPGEFGEKAIVSSVPKSFSDTIFACRGDMLPLLTVNGANTTNLRWYYNDVATNNTSTSFPATISGEYKVKATVSGTCFWSDSVNVRIGQKFPLSLVANPTLVCKNQLVTIMGIVPNTLTGFRIDWSSNNAIPFVENELVQVLSLTGNINIIQLSVRESSGCAQSDTVTVTVNPAYSIYPIASVAGCLNFSPTLRAFANSYPQFYTWTWTNSAKQVLSNNFELQLINLTKSDNYQALFDSENGCKDSIKVYVKVDSATFTKIPDQAICLSQSITLSTTGVDIASYSWKKNGEAGTISSQDSVTVSPKATSVYQLTVKPNLPNICIGTENVTVTVNQLPVYTKSNDTTICKGTSANIFVQNADSVAWKNSSQVGNAFKYTPLAPSTLVFTAFSPFKCAKTDSIKINLFPDYTNTLLGQNFICPGGTLTITALNTKSNLWLNTNQTTQQITPKPISSAVYTFVGTNSNNCLDTSYFPISVNAVQVSKPDFLEAVHSGHLCPQKYPYDTLFEATNVGYGYSWSVGDSLIDNTSNSLLVNKIGIYKLTLTNGFGCQLADTIRVNNQCDTLVISQPEPVYIIPNIITPNTDGYNDVFEIVHLPANSKIEIYNRWGSIIYQSNNYDNLWGANEAADGLYFYKLEINRKPYSGWLLIAR